MLKRAILKRKLAAFILAVSTIILINNNAQAAEDKDINALRAELQIMQKNYEKRISQLESNGATGANRALNVAPAGTARLIRGNSFNPSIGVILNGQYNNFSLAESEIVGFNFGHEGARPAENFSVDHTEFNFAANVDDKFFGSTTFAIAEHDGATEVEMEEAYIQTLPSAALLDGLGVKLGRAFWTLGYLNEHHSHADDFADRPLPYRAFFDNAYNDDGIEVSYVLPTNFYSEIGGGAFRGADLPFAGSAKSAYSAFFRIGGDIGSNHSWRFGSYVLSGEVGEAAGHGHDEEAEAHDEDEMEAAEEEHGHGAFPSFVGDREFFVADIRYIWTPTGNPRAQEVIFQAEYFQRKENGIYELMHEGETPEEFGFDGEASGYYAQAVYKFNPHWRVGIRHSQLEAANVETSATPPEGEDDVGELLETDLNTDGYNPTANSFMIDWTNSEFSRVRLQYKTEELADGQSDEQVTVQYIMSLGAHSAHRY